MSRKMYWGSKMKLVHAPQISRRFVKSVLTSINNAAAVAARPRTQGWRDDQSKSWTCGTKFNHAVTKARLIRIGTDDKERDGEAGGGRAALQTCQPGAQQLPPLSFPMAHNNGGFARSFCGVGGGRGAAVD